MMHLRGRSTGRFQGPLAKVGLSAKFGVAVIKASMLDSLGGGSISQSRFICQVLCTGRQMNLLWLMDPPPSESSIDALNTATPNLADKPTLANGP